MPSPLPLQSSPSSLPCNALIVRELYAEQPGNLLMKKTYVDVEEGHGELSRLCRGALAGPPWLCTTIAVLRQMRREISLYKCLPSVT